MATPTLIIGPPVSEMTREAAAKALESNPKVPKGAEYDIQQHAGHWIAAFVSPVEEKPSKTAAPFGDDEGAAEGGPPSGGDDGPPDDGGPPPDDDSGSSDEDGPPKKKKPGEEGGGLEQMVHQLTQAVHAIAQALGVPLGPIGAGAGPDALDGPPGGPPGPPGAGAPPPPHGGPPPGAGGPPGMGGGKPPMPHERPGPPMPPTFGSVDPRHPWAHTVGQVPHFVVAEQIGEDSYETAEQELQTLARAGGFRVSRFTPLVGQQGERAVQAVIETPRPR